MDGMLAQVLDGANNFDETQSKFPNLRETPTKLAELKGARQSVGGACSFSQKSKS